MKKTNFLVYLTLIFISFFSTLSAQQVSPFQKGHYSAAFGNVRDYAKMAPGLIVISYNYNGWGNTFADRSGKKHDELFIQDIDPDLPAVVLSADVSSFATVPALFWGSEFTLLGGANYVAGITPSMYWANALLDARQEGDNIDSVYTKSERLKISGFGDLFVMPFGLSWGWTHFDATFYYGFVAPTGRFTSGAVDNIGLGHWTHQFQGFGYWYPDDSQASAFLLGLTYELNTKVKDEELNPGDRFSLEWGISQYLNERLDVSIMGGHNWQIADDTGDDVYWGASYHDRLYTMAFSLGYWAVKDRLYLTGKYMFDYGARERFLTQGVMFNIIFVTNALDGMKN